MIKFGIVGHPEYIHFFALHECKKELEDLGLMYTEDKDVDFLLVHTYRVERDFLQKQADGNIPIILLERIAASNVHCRDLLRHPNVIGIVKESTYVDWKINNEPRYEGYYHLHILAKEYGLDKQHPEKVRIPKSSELTEKDMEKVDLWYNFEVYEMMDPFIYRTIDYNQKRDIDICFYGTTDYNRDSLTMHRKKCIEEMGKLKNCNAVYSNKRIKGKYKYVDTMVGSKISVSPWGLGAKCYRDFESIYAGSILLKPDTSFVRDRVDLYNLDNKYYITCKLDYSDLQEKVDWVKTNWDDLKDFRESARNRLLEYHKKESVARHIKKVIDGCLERRK